MYKWRIFGDNHWFAGKESPVPEFALLVYNDILDCLSYLMYFNSNIVGISIIIHS